MIQSLEGLLVHMTKTKADDIEHRPPVCFGDDVKTRKDEVREDKNKDKEVCVRVSKVTSSAWSFYPDLFISIWIYSFKSSRSSRSSKIYVLQAKLI